MGEWGQRPVFKTNITRFVALREITPPVAKDKLRKLIEYFPSPTTEYQLDPEHEDTNKEAKIEKVTVFKDLQKYQSVGLVVPVNAPYMYFAAMESKTCKLTALGFHYWRLVKTKKI